MIAKNKAFTLATMLIDAVCYDARGNGEGGVSPTITGDHENRVTDYTAVVCYSQTSFAQYAEQKPLLRASGGDIGGAARD